MLQGGLSPGPWLRAHTPGGAALAAEAWATHSHIPPDRTRWTQAIPTGRLQSRGGGARGPNRRVLRHLTRHTAPSPPPARHPPDPLPALRLHPQAHPLSYAPLTSWQILSLLLEDVSHASTTTPSPCSRSPAAPTAASSGPPPAPPAPPAHHSKHLPWPHCLQSSSGSTCWTVPAQPHLGKLPLTALCVCVHAHVCTHEVHDHAPVCVHGGRVPRPRGVCVRVSVSMRECPHTRVCMHGCVCTRVCACVRVCTCMGCVHVCVRAHVCVWPSSSLVLWLCESPAPRRRE